MSSLWPSHGLWRHRDFLHLWGAQAVSALGSRITRTVLPLLAILTLDATPQQCLAAERRERQAKRDHAEMVMAIGEAEIASGKSKEWSADDRKVYEQAKKVIPIADGPSLVTQCFAGIDPEPIDWLWRGRIARGKVTILVGDPGLGKSMLTVDMAARITRGKPWPVDGDKAPIGDVLLLSGEDDPADTIRPRLDAAGADVRRVHLLKGTWDADKDGKLRQRQFSLKRDIPFLSAELDKRRYALVVIDPVSAYLDGTDSHNNADVRGLLTPLSDVASAHKVAIVCITHFNKGGSLSALYRTMGSIAFVGQARAVWTVTKDPNDPDGRRRFFVCSKANLAPEPTGLAYCVKPSLANPEIPLIEWEPEPVDVSIENAMYYESEEVRSELQEVREWLTDILSEGPVEAKEVRRFAKDDGHAWATVRRAQYALGVKPRKRDFTGGWVWELPPPKMLKPCASHDEHLEHLRVKPEENASAGPLQGAEDAEDAQGNKAEHFGHLGAAPPSTEGFDSDAPDPEIIERELRETVQGKI